MVSRPAANAEEPEQALDNWEDVLWEHHVLFQDAVNYYLIALLAMATREDNPVWGIKQQLAAAAESEYQVWRDFRRRGELRPGMMRSVAKYLNTGSDEPTPEECYKAILQGNRSKPEVLDLAQRLLLHVCSGDSAIQQQGRSVLPMLCVPGYIGKYPMDTFQKKSEASNIAAVIHDPSADAAPERLAGRLQFWAFANLAEGKPPRTGDEAKALLRAALETTVSYHTPLAERSRHLLDKIASLPTDVSIPAYAGGSVNKEALKRRFHAFLLFHYVEQSGDTLSALRAAVPALKEKKLGADKEKGLGPDFLALGDDPIKLARGKRGYVFPAFTALPLWKGTTEQAEPAWKEFDIAAFKEALKAVHQIDLKTKERNKELERERNRLAYMWGKLKNWKPADPEDEMPHRLAGDERIERLQVILKRDLAVEYEMTEGETTVYGYRRRTIRGFPELQKKWRQIVKPGCPYSDLRREELVTALNHFQAENSERVGSVLLFEVLTREENWVVWREPDEATAAMRLETGHAEDPLLALADEAECRERIQQLERPVRLTPADPVFSVRQYDLNPTKGKGTHVSGQMAIQTALAVRNPETGCFERRNGLRLHYTAPRLVRDGLRDAEEQALDGAGWRQPMTRALVPDLELPQDLSKLAVMLMPVTPRTGRRRFYLNLPVDIDTGELSQKLGKHDFDKADFLGFKDTLRHLRWQADKGKAQPQWPKTARSLHCLAADLGQRDAAAFAIVEAAPAAKAPANGRRLGKAAGKTWYARLLRTGMLRLPGEDAVVWDAGEVRFVQEPSGEKGRKPTDEERREALELCEVLAQETILGEDAGAFSFPQLNDKLLVALRRAQGRLARLHSWAWALQTEEPKQQKRRERVLEDIAKDQRVPDAWRAMAEKQDLTRLAGAIISEIKTLRPRLVDALEKLTNRILPRRNALWVWRKRADVPGCHVLATEARTPGDGSVRIRGQRGLSLERLEQVEELRRRCQSLNRALMHTPGERPVMGRRARGIELPDPCPEILDKMEALREQRVNQTAHLIVAEALGVRLRPPAKSSGERRAGDIHGEYEVIPGRRPADMLVLEDLSRYLTTQDRPRRENSRLMKWCHRAILLKVKELCEPFGIPVLETPPMYSSRFSSRDGQAGFRAVDLTPSHRNRFPWKNDLAEYEEMRTGRKRPSAERARHLEHAHALFEALEEANAGRIEKGKKLRTLLAPVTGGPIFVPMHGPAMQADINAAINLALRALAAPDAHDIHHRIRTTRGKDRQLKVRRDTVLEKQRWTSDFSVEPRGPQPSKAAQENRNPNYFHDAAQVASFGRAEAGGVALASSLGLWSSVKQGAWHAANRLNNDRLEKWGLGRPLTEEGAPAEMPEADIPY